MVCPFRRGHRPGGDNYVAIDTTVRVETVSPPTRSTRALLIKSARILVSAAIAASIVYAVVRLWPEVRSTLLALNPWTVAAAFVAALAAIAANVKAWQAVLHELDHDVSTVLRGRSTWSAGSASTSPAASGPSCCRWSCRCAPASRAPVPSPRRSSSSGSPPPPPSSSACSGSPTLVGVGGAAVWGAAVLAPVALICAIPPVLTRLVDIFLRVLGRAGLNHRLRLTGLLEVMGWSALAWTLFGIHFWLLGAGVHGAAHRR